MDPLKQFFEDETMAYMESRGFTPENGRLIVSLRDGPYKGRTPGDCPEFMPLDSHLFADFKKDVRRYVNRWPGSFSRSTPDRLWALMTAAWESGATPPDHRIVEDCGNWERNLRWVLSAQGAIVPELNSRHGRRLAKRKERTAAKRKAPPTPLPDLSLLLAHFDSSTTPQELEYNELPTAKPPSDEEIAQFGRDFSRRLFVKPGMTGLWQVSGRSDLSFEESVRLDLRYVENWTLALDVFIIWKTVGAMLNRSGAY